MKHGERIQAWRAPSPGTRFARLTPAQLSGDDRLLALERAARNQSPEVDAALRARAAASQERLRSEIDAPRRNPDPLEPDATAADAQALFQRRGERLKQVLGARVERANAKAQQRIAGLSPRMRETRASEIVREELDEAYRAAKEIEGRLWDEVPQEARVPVSRTYQVFDRIVRDTGTAQQVDIPTEAREVLGKAWAKGGIPFDDGPGRVTDQSVREMHALYSKLRETARAARAGTNQQGNKARIADEIADAILVDFGAFDDVPGRVGQTVNAARAFTREVATRFKQGNVGRALGQKARAVDKKGAEFISGRAFLKALTDPDAKPALARVFTQDQRNRLAIVGRELTAVERALGAGESLDRVLPTNTGSAVRVLARMVGAKVGAGIGRGGESLQGAAIMSGRFARWWDALSTSRAEKLLLDGIQDKELFADLLRTPLRSAAKPGSRLSEWLASQGGQMTLEDEQEPEAPPAAMPQAPGALELDSEAPAASPAGNPFERYAPGQQGAIQGATGRVTDLRNVAPPAEARPARTPYELATYFTGLDERREAAILSGFIRSMTGKNLDPAKTAWCAAFVNSVLAASGTEGTGALNARSFLDFGTEARNPQRGDVVVFSRGDPNGWQGHVGFYAGEETKNGQRYIRVLGGNQDDTVSEKLYPASRLLSIRRPPVIRA